MLLRTWIAAREINQLHMYVTASHCNWQQVSANKVKGPGLICGIRVAKIIGFIFLLYQIDFLYTWLCNYNISPSFQGIGSHMKILSYEI